MYNYEFVNEKVINEFVDNFVSLNNEDIRCNILVTNLNILLFKNIKRESVLYGREIHEMPEYDLILKVNLNDIEYEIEDGNTVIYFEKNEIILFDFDLNKVKNN